LENIASEFEEFDLNDFEKLAKELETEEGRKQIGDDTHREALEAEKRGSINSDAPIK